MKGLLLNSMVILSLIITSCGHDKSYVQQSKIHFDKISVDQYEVSIGEFRKFVVANDYVSTADSLSWSGFFDPYSKKWMVADNANWEKPDGRNKLSNNHPVTQISYFDACAYCKWKKGRLPSSVEWDLIAGDSIVLGNVWQGLFPHIDEGNDGYEMQVAPRGKFGKTKSGLYDIFGNVWEWTSTMDSEKQERIIKGGSFLCDFEVCAGYIPSRYQTTPDDSGLNHLGFRCIYDLL